MIVISFIWKSFFIIVSSFKPFVFFFSFTSHRHPFIHSTSNLQHRWCEHYFKRYLMKEKKKISLPVHYSWQCIALCCCLLVMMMMIYLDHNGGKKSSCKLSRNRKIDDRIAYFAEKFSLTDYFFRARNENYRKCLTTTVKVGERAIFCVLNNIFLCCCILVWR